MMKNPNEDKVVKQPPTPTVEPRQPLPIRDEEKDWEKMWLDIGGEG